MYSLRVSKGWMLAALHYICLPLHWNFFFFMRSWINRRRGCAAQTFIILCTRVFFLSSRGVCSESELGSLRLSESWARQCCTFSRRMVQTRSISAYATCAIVITIVTHPVFHPHHWKSRVSLSADVPLLSVVLLYEFDAVATRGTRPAWRPFLAF